MVKGFFSKLDTVLMEGNCVACGLYKQCKTPKMNPSGEGRKGILIIAEAPGGAEDEEGTQFVGRAGQVLREAVSQFGIDLDKDCRKTNAINCRPEKNREPTDKEIGFCRPRIWREILTFKPRVILLLGNPALESFLGHRWPESLKGISRWRGYTIPDREVSSWVCPTFHPSYVMRSSNQPVVETIFKQDLEEAFRLLDSPLPEFVDETKQVSILKDQTEIVEVLKETFNRSWHEKLFMSFDYETTGLKPYRAGHRVVCLSFCVDNNISYCFMMPKGETSIRRWWCRILQNSRIEKTAHNIKFEHLWSSVALGGEVRGWDWCSMQGAHISDNRPGISGLLFQAYVNFGVVDYSEKVQPYMDAVDRTFGSNGFNTIDQCPEDDLLMYCGLDSLIQRRLALKQKNLIV